MERLAWSTDHWSPAWYGGRWAARELIESAAWGSDALPRSPGEGRDELIAAGMDAAMTGDLAAARKILETMRSNVAEAEAEGGSSAQFPAPRSQVAVGELEGLIAWK